MAQKKLIDLYTDEEFKKIIEQSSSIHNIGIQLGYSKNTDVRKIVQERCKKQGLDISKLLGIKLDKASVDSRRKKPEEIFIEDSLVSQSTLRKHYLKGEYTEYKCSICGLGPVWNNKPLTLTLDHVNGNNKDNRLENLRWVCPNCDRQLPTFCGKNMNYAIREHKKVENFCINCGKPISVGAIRCLECHGLQEQKVDRPKKEILFLDLVNFNGNFTQVGKKYNVTDNAIRKWCKAYKLPIHTTDYKRKKEKVQEFQYKVQQIDMTTGEVLNTFNSCSEAERQLKIFHVAEASNPLHSRKSAGGFYWKRIETINLTN